MASESSQDKKARIRPPRVHIAYHVERGGAEVMKELPFVVGVISDLSGHPDEPLPKPKDRKFTEIDRDNFDAVLKSMKPRLELKVENTLADDGSELAVELNFEKLDDFSPEQVAKQVKPLAELLEQRKLLNALRSSTESSERLEEILEATLDEQELRDKLKDALGAEGAGKDQKEGGE
jgi:type VI secretion system protein ImpB